MPTDSKGTLAEVAERFGIPVVAVTYLLAFVVGIRESAGKLGWRPWRQAQKLVINSPPHVNMSSQFQGCSGGSFGTMLMQQGAKSSARDHRHES
jgi:hypothetical protein